MLLLIVVVNNRNNVVVAVTETTNAKVMMESGIKAKHSVVVTVAEDVVDQTMKIIVLMKIAMVCDHYGTEKRARINQK